MARLSDAARAEIADAIRILREDGLHIHKTYAAFTKSQETVDPSPDPGTDPVKETNEDTEGKPPPIKEETGDPQPAKRKSLWWGDRA